MASGEKKGPWLYLQVARLLFLTLVLNGLAGCAGPALGSNGTPGQPLRVLATETFLADIAQNVAGNRLQVQVLLPIGIDPHEYSPTPQAVVKVSESQILIINGAGLEGFTEQLLRNAGGGQHTVVVASNGLPTRQPRPGEPPLKEGGTDPHFWLDPNNAMQYVENIRAALSQADPVGAEEYARNAQAYIAQLQALDQWVREQAQQVPPERRQMITNHEDFGYFADRYGFRITGTLLAGISSESSPSARQLADLIDRIRVSGAPVIFLEIGTNEQLAQQVAQESGIRVVSGLYTHSTSEPDGPAPTYIEMIRYDTGLIVDALK